jgi:hypothetical protein
MGSVIPPEYGIPLSADELMSTIPTSILYGVTPSNEFIPIKIAADGTVATNATFTGTITIGEIGNPDKTSFIYGTSLEQTIGGVYQDANPTLSSGTQGAVRLTQYRAFHVNLRDSLGNEIASTSGSLDVNVTNIVSAGTPVNQYAENTTVPSGVLTTILTYTVPAGKTLNIDGMYGWGQADGEFLIKVDSVVVGGGWSSPSFRTLNIDYSSAPIPANAGQVVTINVTQYYSSTQDFKANLLGTLM